MVLLNLPRQVEYTCHCFRIQYTEDLILAEASIDRHQDMIQHL